jgi:hypothetical protein
MERNQRRGGRCSSSVTAEPAIKFTGERAARKETVDTLVVTAAFEGFSLPNSSLYIPPGHRLSERANQKGSNSQCLWKLPLIPTSPDLFLLSSGETFAIVAGRSRAGPLSRLLSAKLRFA